MKSLSKKIITALFFIFVMSASSALAQGGIESAFDNAKTVASSSGYVEQSVNTLAGDIIRLALTILGTLFVVFIIYAGFLWLTAAGNEQRVDKAKKIIFESTIGLIIVIAAYAITYFIVSAFKGQINL